MTEPMNPDLVQLAGLQFDPAGDAGSMPGQDPRTESAAGDGAATAHLDAAVSALALGILRTMRTVLSRRLPELRDEWPDEVLRGPADALPPVMKRYAGQVSEWAARFPELVVLGVSCMPLAMGYMAAVDKHARTVQDVNPKPAPDRQAAPPPASTAPQPGPDGFYRVG